MLKTTNFKKIFTKTEIWPEFIEHKEKKVFLGDRFPISNKDILTITIEETNSKYRQGFCIDVDGYVKFMGEKQSKGKRVNFFLWEREEPYEVQVFTKEPTVYIRNSWYDPKEGESAPACWAGGDEWFKHDHWGGAGMIVEEIENGRRYYCNDGECDDDFDDIIFTVTRKNK